MGQMANELAWLKLSNLINRLKARRNNKKATKENTKKEASEQGEKNEA